MTAALYWFRNDLRLEDNQALALACKSSASLLPIYIYDERFGSYTRWGFPRVGKHRKTFLQESLKDLKLELKRHGSDLMVLAGNIQKIFLDLRLQYGTNIIYSEHIEAPEELKQIADLRHLGFEIKTIWQSSMLDLKSLPFRLETMPDVFTQFRQQIEKQGLRYGEPELVIQKIPPLPNTGSLNTICLFEGDSSVDCLFAGGTNKGRLHIKQYFERHLVDSYKQTRNQLIGIDYSSKFSPWLALGACSAKWVAKHIADYEAIHGANEGTYWLWFELLWRDYFRFLHFKYGERLYQSKGLGNQKSNSFDQLRFEQWITGNTGTPLIDAGMRELAETGFLSNRMRQIVASYWIYDMQGDWLAGAAWFESLLIDYDVYSNQGNWLYIAGKGTDPRGGRPFNIAKQAKDHDPDGRYQRMWLSNDA